MRRIIRENPAIRPIHGDAVFREVAVEQFEVGRIVTDRPPELIHATDPGASPAQLVLLDRMSE